MTVPAQAITDPGEIDTVHTNVGVVRFTTSAGKIRCSGTLIAPKVVLTAGHSTEGPATNVPVSFEDKQIPDRWRRGSPTPSGVLGCRTSSRYGPSRPGV